jgi:iron complex outermembrane receptor protein
MGETELEPFPAQFVVTFVNFGRVYLNGLDVGVEYGFSERAEGWLNYSFMDPEGFEDPRNDVTGDGLYDELSFNSPENKVSFGLGMSDLLIPGLYGSISGRWVQEYDFISGVHRATKERKDPGAFQFKDRGPLGGFTTFDAYVSYRISPRLQVAFSATDIFNRSLREMVGSPATRRLIFGELKYTLQ